MEIQPMSFVLTAVFGFTLPFFARRFGKFMPADAGTMLFRAFHRPRFAAPADEKRRLLRRKLWGKLCAAGIFWALFLCAAKEALPFLKLPPFYLFFIYVTALLALIDEKIRLLPDALTIPLLIAGFFGAAAELTGMPASVAAFGALAGFVLPTLATLIMTPFRPRAMGGGDFKTLAAVGAWTGFIDLTIAVFLSFFFFAVVAFFKKSKEGPYGLSLFLGVLTVFALDAFQIVDLLVAG